MAMIRLALGLGCIIHPLFPVAVSLAVCVIGLGLIVSAVLPMADNDETNDLDFST